MSPPKLDSYNCKHSQTIAAAKGPQVRRDNLPPHRLRHNHDNKRHGRETTAGAGKTPLTTLAFPEGSIQSWPDEETPKCYPNGPAREMGGAY